MKTKVTKEKITNYLGYLREFKMLLESGKSFSIDDLKKVHDVPGEVNTVAKKTGILNIKGRGKSATHQFVVNDLEPIHARRVAEWIIDNNRMLAENRKRGKVKEVEHPDLFSTQAPSYKRKRKINENTIKKYIGCFNEIKLLVEYNAKFTPSTVAKKHKISTGAMGCAINTGLIKKLPYGKYKFMSPVNEETIKKVIDDVNRITIESKHKLKNLDESETVTENKELPQKIEANKNGSSRNGAVELKSITYKVLGIKIFEKILK